MEKVAWISAALFLPVGALLTFCNDAHAGGYGDDDLGWAAMPDPLPVAPVRIIEAPCECVCAETPEAMEEPARAVESPTGFVAPQGLSVPDEPVLTPDLNERELPSPPDLFWDRFYGGNGGNASPN